MKITRELLEAVGYEFAPSAEPHHKRIVTPDGWTQYYHITQEDTATEIAAYDFTIRLASIMASLETWENAGLDVEVYRDLSHWHATKVHAHNREGS